MLHYFCEVKFKSDQNLQTALELTRLCLINDNQMPVKVEAAIALQVLISNQEKGEQEEVTRLTFNLCCDGSVFFNTLFFALLQPKNTSPPLSGR